MREWCNVARLYRLGTMRNDSTQLTPDRKAVMALIMNQHGLATREVMFHLQRKDGAGRYAFQRAIVRPPHRVVVGRPQVVGGGGEAVAVPAPAPQQTAVVRVERVVARPPPVTPEDEQTVVFVFMCMFSGSIAFIAVLVSIQTSVIMVAPSAYGWHCR